MKQNLFDLEGRVVVMTGATGVLGKSICMYFAQQGAKVAIIVRESSTSKGEALVSAIRAEGGDAEYFVADIMDKSSLEAAREQVMARYGKVDILMNAAGGNMPAATVAPDKTIFDLNTDAVKTVTDLNLFGTVLPTMVFAKPMANQKSGSIINFASESALRPLTRVAGYGVAKAAVVNWTKYLCAEMAMKFGEGIRVNAIAPGFMVNERSKTYLGTVEDGLTKRGETVISHTPMGRFGEASDLIGCAKWLLNEELSGFVTGVTVPIDGGFLTLGGV